ncbi:MAG: thermonuclease [Actinobacteria bacterium]|uniref:Unannotated protein n=1 Tax=freshwater metagenome TaxID=449393 RepID=A0A6J5Z959_9ZZZZ|nr:thermonuclease [Actinomycetota bacterium]
MPAANHRLARIACCLAIAIAGSLAACGSNSTGGAGGSLNGSVIRVVDGDTIIVRLDGSDERVRYIGIDTPETVAPGRSVGCFGPQASKANKALVEGRDVRLVLDSEPRDRYGRLLAYVYLAADGASGRFVNRELVAGGYATAREYPPNTSHAAEFGELEAKARAANRGLWGSCQR